MFQISISSSPQVTTSFLSSCKILWDPGELSQKASLIQLTRFVITTVSRPDVQSSDGKPHGVWKRNTCGDLSWYSTGDSIKTGGLVPVFFIPIFLNLPFFSLSFISVESVHFHIMFVLFFTCILFLFVGFLLRAMHRKLSNPSRTTLAEVGLGVKNIRTVNLY